MTKPIVEIYNIATNEVERREMNDAEYADYEARQTANAARVAESTDKAQAKAALLAKLGITEEEAQLLLGGN